MLALQQQCCLLGRSSKGHQVGGSTWQLHAARGPIYHAARMVAPLLDDQRSTCGLLTSETAQRAGGGPVKPSVDGFQFMKHLGHANTAQSPC